MKDPAHWPNLEKQIVTGLHTFDKVMTDNSFGDESDDLTKDEQE